jgi:hypothetical protein
MSLFVCVECGCVDNTAFPGFWTLRRQEGKHLCTECRTGEWHDKFGKQQWDGSVKVMNRGER